MNLRKYRLMEELADGAAGAEGGSGGGGAAAETTANAANTAASALAPQPSPAQFIPEKFHVKNGEEFDVGASARKMAESYNQLQARMIAGDTPPKTAEEYTVTIPEEMKDKGIEMDDAQLGEFRKEAHALGMTQKQFDLVMGRYMKVAPELMAAALSNTTEQTLASLQKAWGQEYDQHFDSAFKAFQNFADESDRGRFDDIMRDPSLAYRVLAKVGGELREAGAPPRDTEGTGEGESIQALLTSEAAANPKHPDHKATRAKIDGYYAKKYGTQPVS